jgi:16S rRNA (cytidine1402-2'-O)-methyltransferase
LYVVGTPIGNLEDMSFRAVRMLREVQIVLAEDTRQTRKLLSHYGISVRMLSYHQHNKRLRLDRALAALEESDVALVSSAGMPSISDPGFELIQAAVERGFEIDVLPGPSAVITAVVGAALPAPGFLFLGFLPRQRSARRERLSQAREVQASLVLFESPHRLADTLADVVHVLGDRRAVVARELTKRFQEYVRGTTVELAQRFASEPALGEVTLVIAPAPVVQPVDAQVAARSTLERLRSAGASRTAALRQVTAEHGISRNDAYAMWLELARDDAGEG